MPKHILIVAGDTSADQHGAALVQALRAREKDLRISAAGGIHLREAADHFIYPLVGVGGFGFWEPLLKIPQFWTAWHRIKSFLKKEHPDLVIPMDYYGFNIHVARQAQAEGIPVVYYISPQVWASRPHRVQALARVLTKILVIFPFEVEIYQRAGVPVSFVGHPLLDRIPAPLSASPQREKIGLLPGSRRGTVERHLPILVETARRLHQDFPKAEFVLFQPVELREEVYRPFLKEAPWIRLVCDSQYEERKNLSLAISVSGTAALENMLLGIPMVVMYRLSALSYWIAKKLIRVPFVGIPNILAGRPVVPELLQDQATPTEISKAAKSLLDNPSLRQQMRDTLLTLRQTLQEGGSQRAAEEILKEFRISDFGFRMGEAASIRNPKSEIRNQGVSREVL